MRIGFLDIPGFGVAMHRLSPKKDFAHCPEVETKSFGRLDFSSRMLRNHRLEAFENGELEAGGVSRPCVLE